MHTNKWSCFMATVACAQTAQTSHPFICSSLDNHTIVLPLSVSWLIFSHKHPADKILLSDQRKAKKSKIFYLWFSIIFPLLVTWPLFLIDTILGHKYAICHLVYLSQKENEKRGGRGAACSSSSFSCKNNWKLWRTVVVPSRNCRHDPRILLLGISMEELKS